MEQRGFAFIETRYKRMGICLLLFMIFIQQFSGNFMYSLDDYYLENIYDLDWKNLGYNYYAYGRFAEGILAEIVCWLNLSPLNGTTAFLLWGASVVFLADYIVEKWRVEGSVKKMLYMLLIMFNPFFAELYFYRNILGFSSAAVFALWGGLRLVDVFWTDRSYIHLLAGGLCIVLSLSIYQIFFPLVFMIYAVELFTIEKDRDKAKKIICSFLYTIVCLLVYDVLINIAFYIKPSTVYQGMEPGLLVQNLLLNKNNYWGCILGQLTRFIFKDNMLSSGAVNILIMLTGNLMFGSVLLVNMAKKEFRTVKAVLITFMAFLPVQIFGLLSCFGFSITDVMGTSSRSFTAWSVYCAGVLRISEVSVREHLPVFKSKCFEKAMLVMMAAAFITNAARISRCATDVMKMNQIEENLVNRITAKLETYDSFHPENIKIYVHGYADLSDGYSHHFAWFNHPAVGGFSTVFAFREITGYHFSPFSGEESEKALTYIPEMEKWPAANSIMETDAGFIIKLGD